MTIGRAAAARIQAVEGIALSPEMTALFRSFDEQGLSPEERRRVILRRYGGRAD